MTVRENVKAGFHIHTQTALADALFHTKRYKKDESYVEDKVQTVLEKVGLISYAEVLAGNLSYGIQRRVEIARVLALDPDIILLDEPAAGMNAKETQNLLRFIKELNAEKYTVVVIEHDMKFIMNLCNRIMVLNFGKKICEGDRDEVKNNSDVHTAYFGKGISFDFAPGGETNRAGS
jgi:branched-chain amino acid transport system ATP-binding protein